jgi:hypothetical protein
VLTELFSGTDPRFEFQSDYPARRAGPARAPYAPCVDGQSPDIGGFP